MSNIKRKKEEKEQKFRLNYMGSTVVRVGLGFSFCWKECFRNSLSTMS